ncbi:MAG: DUF1059 domain-containing protein [Haloferacaceae archaeon]
MAKEVNCKEAEYEDCEFLVRSENEDELVSVVQRHAERAHDMSVSRKDVEGLMKTV